jgi:hypothetical protein
VRRLGLGALLAACACTQNHAELRRVLADHERVLATQMARADTLNEQRKDVDALEARLQAALERDPRARAAIDVAPPRLATTPIALPPLARGLARRARGARLRRHIADTAARRVEISS